MICFYIPAQYVNFKLEAKFTSWCLSYVLDFFLTFFPFQFTEEKLGQAEKTELDPHLDNLITRADGTKNWTEKILRQTEVLLQPNPSKRRNNLKKNSQLEVSILGIHEFLS